MVRYGRANLYTAVIVLSPTTVDYTCYSLLLPPRVNSLISCGPSLEATLLSSVVLHMGLKS